MSGQRGRSRHLTLEEIRIHAVTESKHKTPAPKSAAHIRECAHCEQIYMDYREFATEINPETAPPPTDSWDAIWQDLHTSPLPKSLAAFFKAHTLAAAEQLESTLASALVAHFVDVEHEIELYLREKNNNSHKQESIDVRLSVQTKSTMASLSEDLAEQLNILQKKLTHKLHPATD